MNITLARLLPLILLVGCGNTTAPHFSGSIPQGSELLHEFSRTAGFADTSTGLVFSVADGQLRDQFVREWELEVSENPTSFLTNDAPDWWPTPQQRSEMGECYSRVQEGDETYRSLWYDQPNERLYVEYGNW